MLQNIDYFQSLFLRRLTLFDVDFVVSKCFKDHLLRELSHVSDIKALFANN